MMEYRQKIIDLFALRQIPMLMTLANIDDASFLEDLYHLQFLIYELDNYLETHWEIDHDKLETFWSPIAQKLSRLDVNEEQIPSYLAHITRYQKHELQLRKKIFPSRYTQEYFYYYKSCDVRLMRQLIYDKSSGLKSNLSLSDWRYFDLITELVDDIDDVFEDTLSINGNAILIGFYEQGVGETLTQAIQFIKSIEQKSVKRLDKYGSARPLLQKIHKLTIEQCSYALKKLKDSKTDYIKIDLTNCTLLKYYDSEISYI